MGFLYKHYEKIILAFFLLVFVSALVYLIMVFSQSHEISEDDLTGYEKKIQALTDTYIKGVADVVTFKENELLTI